MDHYSRRVLGFRLFLGQPNSKQISQFLRQVVARIGTAPGHLVTDRGKQFCDYRLHQWCRRHAIRQRFGAVGQRGSIAVVERFIRTLKESLRALTMVSLQRRVFQMDVHRAISWHNADRPHMTMRGATPNEVYYARRPACRRPRFEPRPGWPRVARCAQPQVLVKGRPGTRLELSVEFLANQHHLPRVTICRAA